MARARGAVAGLVMASWAAGCGGGGDDGLGVSFDVHVPPAPLSAEQAPAGDRCPKGQGDLKLKRSDIIELRVTFTDARTGQFVCDSVLSTATGERRKLAVPRFASAVNLLVEGYSGVGASKVLVASGQSFDVLVGNGVVRPFPDGGPGPIDAAMMLDSSLVDAGDGGSADAGDGGPMLLPDASLVDASVNDGGVFGQGVPKVLLAPSREFACTADTQAVARGFHSATVLPNGQVLLAGGLVADRLASPPRTTFDLAGRAFLATEAVEVYDPGSGRFTLLTSTGSAAKPRALHQAVLLNSPPGGPYRVLLVGGVGPAMGMSPDSTSVMINSLGLERMRLVPGPGAAPVSAEILEYTPAAPGGTPTLMRIAVDDAKLVQRMLATASPNPPPAELASELIFPGRNVPLLSVGGVSEWEGAGRPAPVPTANFEVLNPQNGEALGKVNLVVPRIGAQVVPLSDSRAIVWGGNLLSPNGMEAGEVATSLEGLLTAPVPRSMTVMGTPAPVPTVFGTATALDEDELLVVGGFQIAGGFATNPAPSRPMQIVKVNPTSVSTSDIPAPDFKPVGWHEATRVVTGEVLISGGSPGFIAGTLNDCPTGLDGLLCSMDRAYTFMRDSGGITVTTLPVTLLVSRFGHRAVTLKDGTVLLTGGLHYEKPAAGTPTLSVVSSAELWNPRNKNSDAAKSGLPIGATRMPGDVARFADGSAVRECVQR